MARSRLVLQERKRDKRMRQASGMKDYGYQTHHLFHVELFWRRQDWRGQEPAWGTTLQARPRLRGRALYTAAAALRGRGSSAQWGGKQASLYQ